MKKANQIRIRIDDDERAAFRAGCDACGVKASAVIRDLCKAAIPWLAVCQARGRWYPPRLVQDMLGGDLGRGGQQLLAAEGPAVYSTSRSKNKRGGVA